MQPLKFSGVLRPIYGSLGVKRLILSSPLRLGYPSGLFPSCLHTNLCMHLTTPIYVPRALLTSFFLVIFPA